jgi:hypothetical protein
MARTTSPRSGHKLSVSAMRTAGRTSGTGRGAGPAALSLCAGIVFGSLGAGQAATLRYTIRALAPPAQNGLSCSAAFGKGINQTGAVLGYELCIPSAGYPLEASPVVWRNGVARIVAPAVPVRSADSLWVGGLTDSGDLLFGDVGFSPPHYATYRFERMRGGTYVRTKLNGFGFGGENATAQNATGVVAGSALEVDGYFHAALFQRDGRGAIDIYPSSLSRAIGVDRAGHVAGYRSRPNSFFTQAFVFDGKVAKLIPLSQGAIASWPVAKAAAGGIVGVEVDASRHNHVIVWNDAGAVLDSFDCNRPHGVIYPTGINDAGDVVGDVGVVKAAPVPFLHHLGGPGCINLRPYLPASWPAVNPEAIDDAGRIAGEWWSGGGSNALAYHAFSMVPR